MHVNVLISQNAAGAKARLLVTPFGKNAAIPDELQELQWRNIATAETDDRLLRLRRPRIEAEIACRGYALIST